MRRNGILREGQAGISDDIYIRLEKRELFNIPTGRGKTFILLDVAIHTILEREIPVIISVPNNYLVKEAAQVAMKYFDVEEENIGIRIGLDNYVDMSRLQILIDEHVVSSEYFETEKAITFFKANAGSTDVLFDEFFLDVPLKDIAFEGIVRQKICRLAPLKKVEEFKPLTITNHYYLLSKAVFDKTFNINEFVVLIDEVHEIADVAEQVFTGSFSFFEYKNTLQSLIGEVRKMDDYRGKLRAMDILRTQAARANKYLRKNSDEGKVGSYVMSGSQTQPLFDAATQLVGNDEHQYINKKILKRVGGNYSQYFHTVSSFMNDFNGIKIASEKTTPLFGVYYSPSRGYPTLRVSKGNPMGLLHKAFWEKVGMFAGVSGSCTSSFSPSQDDIRYGYARLGALTRKESREIHYYPRVFPKENVTVHLIENPHKKDSVYSPKFDSADSPYYEWIIDTIHRTLDGKNALVLCGGYKEAQYLAALYKHKYGDTKTHHANTREKTHQTVDRFRRDGGILFGTKNYGLGLSLEGEALERMYLLKLPYSDFTTKKWQEVQAKGMGTYYKNYTREMLITLIQNFGRLARTQEDTGEMYLFAKLHKNIRKEVGGIAAEYGIIRDEREGNTKKSVPFEIDEREMEALFL